MRSCPASVRNRTPVAKLETIAHVEFHIYGHSFCIIFVLFGSYSVPIIRHAFNSTLLCTFHSDLQCEVYFVFYMKTENGGVMNCPIKEDRRKHKLF